MEKKEFVWSFREDVFYSPHFDSVEECLEDARECSDDEKRVWIGVVAEPKIRLDLFGDQIAESISENLGDEVGEVAESFDPSAAQLIDLGERIEPIVKQWLKEIGGYGCYKVTDIGDYDLETGKLFEE